MMTNIMYLIKEDNVRIKESRFLCEPGAISSPSEDFPEIGEHRSQWAELAAVTWQDALLAFPVETEEADVTRRRHSQRNA